jgi:hypothetical protein
LLSSVGILDKVSMDGAVVHTMTLSPEPAGDEITILINHLELLKFGMPIALRSDVSSHT